MNWAKKIFNDWLQVWQIRIDEVPKVFKCCDKMTLEDLDHCLQNFCQRRARSAKKKTDLGINQIAKVLPKLTTHLKDGKTYSNNSLRRTTKTRLVENNISNEISKRIVCHLSFSDSCCIDQNALENESFCAIKGSKRSMILFIFI